LNDVDKTDFSTFSYSNLINNKINEKIKLLFNKRHVYKLDEILHLLRSATVKKLEVIRTLNEMIEYKTTISDKFSKTGYIVQIADLYLFQPDEISDPQILMYDRMRPIPLKEKYFKGELEEVKEEIDFFGEIKALYTKATTEKENDDWYSLYYTASHYMINKVGISRDSIDQYLITHLFDYL
jgi:diphthamide synthase subunit DPH2